MTASITSTPTGARSAASGPGFTDLDTLTTGLQKSDLIVLAARPSVGKTSLALNIAEHAAVRDRRSVGVFSLEMSKEQLVLRMLSSVANIDRQNLRTRVPRGDGFRPPRPGDERAVGSADVHRRHAEHLGDGAADEGPPTPGGGRPRSHHRRLPPADAGDEQNRDANRVQEVSEISRGLKALARELNVPVIALSQLSRQPEMRESKEPRLSDLRESGAIEQDADLVIFLWREKERGAEDQDAEGEVINVHLAKHRNGPTGELKLWFKKRQTRFVSYAGERYADVAG